MSGPLVAVAIYLAIDAVLSDLLPDARPTTGMVGLLAGVIVGTRLAGLDGARGWVVVPVITLALGLILGGMFVAISSLRLP